METFSVQALRIVQHGIEQVQYAFKVGDNFHPLILKYLVRGLHGIIEIHFITKAGTSAADHTYPKKMFLRSPFFFQQGLHTLLGFITDINAGIYLHSTKIIKGIGH